jgi:tRNA dimethylallyltransferase
MIVVYGPTGVGKTAFVDELAQSIPAEIVNADMGQLYVPLSIGTAKPDWRHAPVPHHLFDVINEPVRYTVVAYRELVKKTMDAIWKKNKIPILVGGSAFYLKSLFFPPISNDIKETVLQEDDLWEQLNTIDPDRASKIPKQDSYRLKRALALYQGTGAKPSEFKPVYDPPADSYLMICLTRDRKELYERIDRRVLEMFDQGWSQEVSQLLGTNWESFILEKKIIGYDDIVHYLKNGDHSYDDLLARIQKRTRNYAKRQMTFWRMLKRQLEEALGQELEKSYRCCIEEVNLTCIDLHLYIEQLQKRVKSMLAQK